LPLCDWLASAANAASDAQSPAVTTSGNDVTALITEGWRLQTLMHKDLANLQRAVDLYRQALALAPDHAEAHWRLAEVTFKSAEELSDVQRRQALYNEALTLAARSIELDATIPAAYYWRGSAHARLADLAGVFNALGHLDQARADLDTSIRLKPEDRYAILARVVLAAIYTEAPWPLGDTEKAEALARDARRLDPNLTIACEKLLATYISEEKWPQARQEATSCLAIDAPTYVWDAELHDWPAIKALIEQIPKEE